MSEVTPRLALPMIVPGQAQKEMAHNEALALIDAAVQSSVLAANVDLPPSDPVAGQGWIVGDAPSGDWDGHAGEVATWTEGGWRFVVPTPGFRAWVVDSAVDTRFIDGVWQMGVVQASQLVVAGHVLLSTPVVAISDPVGGTVDSGARAAIGAILAALRHHNLVEGP